MDTFGLYMNIYLSIYYLFISHYVHKEVPYNVFLIGSHTFLDEQLISSHVHPNES